jgi:hypothetical protein
MDGVNIELERLGHARTALRVSGRLRPGWCGSLATGLAGLGVDIVRGAALTSGAGIWKAEFELRCPKAGHLESEALGRLLKARPGASFASPLELLGYRLGRSTTHGGCLHLEVEALDRVGLIAALLRRLAYYSLFPAELRLETVDGIACDQLWLRGGAGSTPPPGSETALAARLEALVSRGSRASRVSTGPSR